MTDNTARLTDRSTICSPVAGCIPPSASVVPIHARSTAVTTTQLCRV